MPTTEQRINAAVERAHEAAEARFTNRLARRDGKIRRLERQVVMYGGALSERLADLTRLSAEFEELRVLCNRRGDQLVGYARNAHVMRAQQDALQTHLDALAQRYAGVKIDTQQFTFAAAHEWLKAERDAVLRSLNAATLNAQREFDQPDAQCEKAA